MVATQKAANGQMLERLVVRGYREERFKKIRTGTIQSSIFGRRYVLDQ
jgi:hypothetical protein